MCIFIYNYFLVFLKEESFRLLKIFEIQFLIDLHVLGVNNTEKYDFTKCLSYVCGLKFCGNCIPRTTKFNIKLYLVGI